jgi:UDP-N-acetylmuramate--alanine ligase
MNILKFNHFYLVGIKGVAMTSIMQCLVDAGKTVTGCDVAEDFVTKEVLDKKRIKIDIGFEGNLPKNTDCVIYTAAHLGQNNPMVQQADSKNIPTFSQAEALASLFNQKKGIAVCGVGGKSTVSAMISWILEKTGYNPSYSVGVGEIIGLEQTGKWNQKSQYFVAEADEYVVDPAVAKNGQKITPRFSFLKPFLTVCTNLKYDHPDVYQNFDHTKQTFNQFFSQIQPGGILIINADNQALVELSQQQQEVKIISFGEIQGDFRLIEHSAEEGQTVGRFTFAGQNYQIILKIPGKFNLLNALAAISACHAIGVDILEAIEALASFASTKRRFEYIGQKNGIKYYDDYAHHPSEVYAAIKALNSWYPNNKKLVAFQSHTFSRTKQLFDEFVDAFKEANHLVMIDIFASARESFDQTVSSDLLCQEIEKKYPHIQATNVKTIEKLAKFLKDNLENGDVCLTIGAGDIYEVHQLI